MRGRLERCWLFAYQTPVEAARRLLPEVLQPVTVGDRAFWSVVVCRIRGMRPRGVPAVLGIDYWHVAYRLYVRFTPRDGPSLSGLYFLRSDCDSPLITAAGNCLTEFRFHNAAVSCTEEGGCTRLEVASPDAPAAAVLDREQAPRLPDYSAFASLEEAERCLKYGPAGFSVTQPGSVNLLSITRDEAAWQSRAVHVEQAEWRYLQNCPARLELCMEVAPIEYQWNRERKLPARTRRMEMDETEIANVNAALEECLSSWLSPEAEAEIRQRFGAETAARVRAIYDAAMGCPVDWSTASMDRALDVLHAFLAQQYPWLSEKARTRLNYCYIMCWK